MNGVTADWDDFAAEWDDDPAAQAYAVAAHQSLVALLGERRLRLDGMRVLDFGCGTGLLAEQLVADGVASIDAVDTSPAMLDVLEDKRLRSGWDHVRTSQQLPGAPDGYDLVVCSSVCSFLPDYFGTAAHLVTLLRPGGVFVQWDWELDLADDDPHGLSRDAIRDALGGAGLSNIEVDIAFRVAIDGSEMTPLVGIGSIPT
jgi:2-polyprenyl-3-methyl-5-hydroxy-6-metoxy-1,4-benzoquinol methylase